MPGRQPRGQQAKTVVRAPSPMRPGQVEVVDGFSDSALWSADPARPAGWSQAMSRCQQDDPPQVRFCQECATPGSVLGAAPWFASPEADTRREG